MDEKLLFLMGMRHGLRVFFRDDVNLPNGYVLTLQRLINYINSDVAYVPICYNPSDLTKEIVHNGDTFVPIVRLAEIASNETGWVIGDEKNSAVKYITSDDYYIFCFDNYLNSFTYQLWSESDCLVPYKKCNQFELMLKLIEWHFAVGIEDCDFIDVNKLPKNPYE